MRDPVKDPQPGDIIYLNTVGFTVWKRYPREVILFADDFRKHRLQLSQWTELASQLTVEAVDGTTLPTL